MSMELEQQAARLRAKAARLGELVGEPGLTLRSPDKQQGLVLLSADGRPWLRCPRIQTARGLEIALDLALEVLDTPAAPVAALSLNDE